MDIQSINFTDNIDGFDYDVNKAISSNVSYNVINPIDLIGVRVRNYRTEEYIATVDETIDVLITLDNPNGYNADRIVLNDITYVDFDSNELNTILTVTVPVGSELGNVVFELDSIRFELFNNIQTYNIKEFTAISFTVEVVQVVFANDIQIVDVYLDANEVFYNDIVRLYVELENEYAYDIDTMVFDGLEYDSFNINDENTLLSFLINVGAEDEILFNFDSLDFDVLGSTYSKEIDSLTTFEIGNDYEREIFYLGGGSVVKYMFSTVAPFIDDMFTTTQGRIITASVGGVLLSALVYLTIRKKNKVIRRVK